MKRLVLIIAFVMCFAGCGNNNVPVGEEIVNGNNNLLNQPEEIIETKNEEVLNETENEKTEEIKVENILDDEVKKPVEITKPQIEESNLEEVIYEDGVSVGNKAKNFEVELLSGEKVKLSDYFGKPIFLNFWATWCGPCIREMPDIQKIKDEYGDKVIILAVNAGELKDDVKKFIDKTQYTFNIGIDEKGDVLDLYDSMYIPLSLFIDEKGVIKERRTGTLPEEDMRSLVESLISTEN